MKDEPNETWPALAVSVGYSVSARRKLINEMWPMYCNLKISAKIFVNFIKCA